MTAWSRKRSGVLFLIAGLFILETLPGAARLDAGIASEGSLWLRDGVGRELEGDTWGFDALGLRIAVGDWNGDGRDDLAVSDFEQEELLVPGAVHVIYSGPSGEPLFDELWQDFDPALLTSDVEEFDTFGWALASGDFSGDGFDDLAIGIPGEVIGPAEDAGMVMVLYGTPEGLGQAGAPLTQRWRIGGGMTAGQPAATDQFGYALAAGDFDGDGYDDLAVGIPLRDVGMALDAGSVLAIYGGAAGLAGDGHRFFDQNSQVAGEGEMLEIAGIGDRFGSTLASGNFDSSSLQDDLAIGVPGETLAAGAEAGLVQVLYGFPGPSSRGLRITLNQLWDEESIAAGGAVEPGDRFGSTLAAGDVTGDGHDDLVVGAPEENVGGVVSAGAVTVVRGSPTAGLVAINSSYIDESELDGETAELQNRFGSAIAIGDFITDVDPLDRLDLAIGIPGQSIPSSPAGPLLDKVGAVALIQGHATLAFPDQVTRFSPGVAGVAGQLGPQLSFGAGLGAGDFDGDGHTDLAVGAPGTDDPAHGAEDAGALHILFSALFGDGFENGDTDGWDSVAL